MINIIKIKRLNICITVLFIQRKGTYLLKKKKKAIMELELSQPFFLDMPKNTAANIYCKMYNRNYIYKLRMQFSTE